MSHDHAQGQGGHILRRGHSHGRGEGNSQARVGWVALLTGAFMVAEAMGGVLSGSLALLADAGHMLTDAASLALAWFAFRIARRPWDWARTYGFHRFQVLAAYSNGLTLVFIALAICYEAARRLSEPGEVLAGPMLGVAVAGMVVNVAAFLILHGAERENLNVRGAMLHVVGDLLGSVAAIAAAVVILWTGWTPIDPLLSVLVALLILRSAWVLIAESGHILLQGTPRGLDIPALKGDLVAVVPGVEDVHHVHVWSLTEARPMATLHVKIAHPADAARVSTAVKARLREHYGIDHATVEVECDDVPGAQRAG